MIEKLAFARSGHFWTIVMAATSAIVATIAIIQLHISRQLLMSIQRAFVTSPELQIEVIKWSDGQVRLLRLAPVLENSGVTPLQHGRWQPSIFLWFAARTPPDVAPPSEPPTVAVQPDKLLTIVLAPKAKTSLSLSEYDFPADTIEAIKSASVRLYVYGTVLYDDIFSAHHITKFCYAVRPDPATGDLSYSMCSGNSNCTDDDCKEK